MGRFADDGIAKLRPSNDGGLGRLTMDIISPKGKFLRDTLWQS